MKASALANPIDIAQKLIDYAKKYFNGEKLPEKIPSPTTVVTSENIAEFNKVLAEIRNSK